MCGGKLKRIKKGVGFGYTIIGCWKGGEGMGEGCGPMLLLEVELVLWIKRECDYCPLVGSGAVGGGGCCCCGGGGGGGTVVRDANSSGNVKRWR